MDVIYGHSDIEVVEAGCGIGLGNFDGLHIGHMELINQLIKKSVEYKLKSFVYTFYKHPENILGNKSFNYIITKQDKKIRLLKNTSLDILCFEEFTDSFSKIAPREFVKNILVDELNIKLAVVGFDYSFGHKGMGDVALLKELGEKYGFKTLIIPKVKIDNKIVSSTYIRKLISIGNVEKVNVFLGRNYSIEGVVLNARKIGRTIGFPTANIQPQTDVITPKNGVYISKTLIDGIVFKSLTNVGINPTFPGTSQISIETYIIDFNEDIYGKEIEVFFIKKIRDEIRFGNKEDLIHQIRNDVKIAKEYFNNNI
jgi:riboflavin kinase / FMN adenylyltransferase